MAAPCRTALRRHPTTSGRQFASLRLLKAGITERSEGPRWIQDHTMKAMLVGCALSLLFVGVAFAQEPEPSWTCNAGPGQFSRNGLAISTPPFVSGTIKFQERHGGSEWGARAAVNFRKARGEEKFGGLAFYYANPADKALTIDLAGFGSHPKPVGQILSEGPIHFSVGIDADGTVTATIDGKTYTTKGHAFSEGIGQASCSSAKAQFSALNVPVIIY
jgi:hypothetical protein